MSTQNATITIWKIHIPESQLAEAYPVLVDGNLLGYFPGYRMENIMIQLRKFDDEDEDPFLSEKNRETEVVYIN